MAIASYTVREFAEYKDRNNIQNCMPSLHNVRELMIIKKSTSLFIQIFLKNFVVITKFFIVC